MVPWWDYTPKWLGWRSLGLSPDTIATESTVRAEFLGRFLNSTIISLTSSALAVVLGSLAAYGLSRFSYRFGYMRNADLSFFFLSQLILPPVVLALPWVAWRRFSGGRPVAAPWTRFTGGIEVAAKPPGSTRIWLHGVSVGEVQLLGVLADELLRQSQGAGRPLDCVISSSTTTLMSPGGRPGPVSGMMTGGRDPTLRSLEYSSTNGTPVSALDSPNPWRSHEMTLPAWQFGRRVWFARFAEKGGGVAFGSGATGGPLMSPGEKCRSAARVSVLPTGHRSATWARSSASMPSAINAMAVSACPSPVTSSSARPLATPTTFNVSEFCSGSQRPSTRS
jgi:hypothetical protein